MKILKIKPGPQNRRSIKKSFDQVVEGKIKNEKQALLITSRLIN